MYRVTSVLVLSMKIGVSSMSSEGEGEERERMEETEVFEVEANETADIEEVREEGRESVSELSSWSGVVHVESRMLIANALPITPGANALLVGVGERTEISHLGRKQNIRSVSMSSCLGSRSFRDRGDGIVQCFREARRAVFEIGTEVRGEQNLGQERSLQTMACRPSGMCTETDVEVMIKSNADPPRIAIHSFQGRLVATQAAWIGRGGIVSADKERERVATVRRERDVARRADASVE
jgi:hypothetical protein